MSINQFGSRPSSLPVNFGAGLVEVGYAPP